MEQRGEEGGMVDIVVPIGLNSNATALKGSGMSIK